MSAKRKKRRIKPGERLRGTSISGSILPSADEAIISTIQQDEGWTLTRRESEVVVEALLYPRAPSSRMKAAVARYRRLVKNS